MLGQRVKLRVKPYGEVATRRRGSAALARSLTCNTRHRISGSEPGREWISDTGVNLKLGGSPRNTRCGLCTPDGSVCYARLLDEHAPGLPHRCRNDGEGCGQLTEIEMGCTQPRSMGC